MWNMTAGGSEARRFFMATKPTRMQQKACDDLAEALLLITQAARLDGMGKLDPESLGLIADRLAHATSAFGLDEIIARALERRGRYLELSGTTAELLSLVEADMKPLEMLLLSDEEFKALVARIQEELGEA
jgi:hypothetical protein